MKVRDGILAPFLNVNGGEIVLSPFIYLKAFR